MKSSMLSLAILTACVLAGNTYRLETPVFIGGSDGYLSYDDGTSWWLTWDGLYRGVWFDLEDFDPLGQQFHAYYTEYWFYHHSSYPWDTSSFYAELWNGSVISPATMLDQTSIMAVHNAPAYAYYSPGILTEYEFWCLANTSMSSGGWPSLLGDNTPHDPSHSFYSDDFIIWEPWIIQGPMSNDYIVRALGSLGDLASESWGSIKGMFR